MTRICAKRSDSRGRREAGFTLLEVLVAFAVLTISLGVLLRVFSGSVDRQNIVQDQKTALSLAESKLAALGSEIPLVDGTYDGVFDNGFGWSVEIAPYPESDSTTALSAKQATLTVRWPRAKGPYAFTLQTLRAIRREQPARP